MIVGTIGYETHQGLGHLVRDFYQHGILHKLWPVRHRHYQNHPAEWIAGEDRIRREEFIATVDVFLAFETPFYWDTVKAIKDKGGKFILVPNYEWSPYGESMSVEPDLVLCPSLLDLDYYQAAGYRAQFLTIPVDTERHPWTEKWKAEVFIHNAGHGQWNYAKGTPEVLEAMSLVKSDARLLVRGQPDDSKVTSLFSKYKGHPRIEFRLGHLSERELYDGDVFVNAEKINGLSLPLQEAFASGLAVITTDRYPANAWLPPQALVPVDNYSKDTIRNGLEFDVAHVKPEDIAAQIDRWYGQDIWELSMLGRMWAMSHSWQALGEEWREVTQCL
jgi:glycosyltransferase involved in cell wall biosynthesis